MDIVTQPVGAEAKVELKLDKGVLVLEVGYDGKGADAGFFVKLDSDYFIDKLAELIPGQVDDAILGVLKMALKAQ